MTIEAAGFQTQQETNLTVDSDAAVRVDAVMEVRRRKDAVTVVESGGAIQTLPAI